MLGRHWPYRCLMNRYSLRSPARDGLPETIPNPGEENRKQQHVDRNFRLTLRLRLPV